MTVPLITLVSGVILWCIWLTIKVFQNDKEIAVNTTNDATIKIQINDVKADLHGRIDKLEKHVDGKFDRVFKEIDSLRR